MNFFTNLTDHDIDAIIRNVNREAIRLGVSENFNSPSACDSRSYYHEYYASLLHTRDSLLINDGEFYDINGKIYLPQNSDTFILE